MKFKIYSVQKLDFSHEILLIAHGSFLPWFQWVQPDFSSPVILLAVFRKGHFLIELQVHMQDSSAYT